MGIFKTAARVFALLTMQRDPYPEKYRPPEILSDTIENGIHVLIVRADNYRDVTAMTPPLSPTDGPTRVNTKIGPRTWKITTE